MNLVFVRYFDEMYVVSPLVVLCERRLHDTSPLFGPREAMGSNKLMMGCLSDRSLNSSLCFAS